MLCWPTMERFKTKMLGEPVKLDQDEIKEANRQLNEQIEGEWRLPSRKELESLVCDNVKVQNQQKLFLTPLPPFWTSQKIGGLQSLFGLLIFYRPFLWTICT